MTNRYRITVEGQTFDVVVLDDPRQPQVRVEVDGQPLTVSVESGPPASGTAALPSQPAPTQPSVPAADRWVTAPLPGIIKSIAVKIGQRVTPGDELLTIEAMKMDNVVRAGRAGRIAVVRVSVGRQVAYGDPLIEFAGQEAERG
jgi:biotin carboxyl carrier protein